MLLVSNSETFAKVTFYISYYFYSSNFSEYFNFYSSTDRQQFEKVCLLFGVYRRYHKFLDISIEILSKNLHLRALPFQKLNQIVLFNNRLKTHKHVNTKTNFLKHRLTGGLIRVRAYNVR